MPSTGQFLNSTCTRTNQSSEDIIYSAVLTERIRRQRRKGRFKLLTQSATHTPPFSAQVRGISLRVPIGVSMRKRRSKKKV